VRIADALPLSHAVSLVRPLLLGQMPQQIGLHLGVLAAITVLAFWLALGSPAAACSSKP
jgi:lipooligosaccharide transport system permease protein